MFLKYITLSPLLLLAIAAYSQTPYRAIVETRTILKLSTGKKVIESLSTIAVKGEKYRLQTMRPTASLCIFDGNHTISVNPVTGETQRVKHSALRTSSNLRNILANLKNLGWSSEFDVPKSFGLSENIQKLKITYNEAWKLPGKIEFLDARQESVGSFITQNAFKLSGKYIPSKTTYTSDAHGQQVTVMTEYRDIKLDPDMPDEVFATNEKIYK